MKKQSNRKWPMLFLLLLMPLVILSANGRGDAASNDGAMEIRFMTKTYSGDPMPNDSIILDKVREYTGMQVEMEFVPDSVYSDKLNIILASGDLPHVLLADKSSSSFIKACQVGAFWELGPYLEDYSNLKDMNSIVLNNASIDGKIYGLYRARDLGRNGVIFRSDWLENVGLEPPETTDDFYDMLYQFTYGDPDQNGQNDTFGMIVCSYQGPFIASTVWFGAPNGWGEDSSGKLVPAHMTDEFFEAMEFWHKIWKEGLINQDFPVFNCGDWRKPVIAEEAGVIADVLDGAGRWENDFIKVNNPAEIGMVGTINGRTLPTSGYSGMFAISKDTVKTEAELRQVLDFMNKLNDPEMQDLLGWGIEGRHWVENEGYIDPQPVEDNPDLKSEINDANQMLMFINKQMATGRKTTDIRKRSAEIMVENIPYCVGNPAEPLIPSSETYAMKGATLDQLIKDGYYQFIVGEMDKAGWEALLDQWSAEGGADLIAEINDLYKSL